MDALALQIADLSHCKETIWPEKNSEISTIWLFIEKSFSFLTDYFLPVI